MSSNDCKQVLRSEESEPKVTEIVAKHYNNLEEKGINARKESRIYYLRNFNNWIKSVTIAEIMDRIRDKKGSECDINVLDIGCGKGGDLLKYRKANITHIICADIAQTSVTQCEDRYNEMKSNRRGGFGRNNGSDIFTAEFITADCTRERLKDHYKNPNISFDLVSIQFSFHYCFESLFQTNCMIKNVSERLRIGGIFIGTTTDSQEIIKRLRKSGSNGFGNSVYSIKFEDQYIDSDHKIPIFGAKYDFHLEGVVDCPEFLVYFPVFVEICQKYGLKLIYRKNFGQIFNENKEKREHKQLLTIMSALEVYSTQTNNSLVGNLEDDYKHAKELMEKSTEGQERQSLGTISRSEWEAISIYTAFFFEKVSDFEINETSNKRLKTQ